jgi:hypothetical protein
MRLYWESGPHNFFTMWLLVKIEGEEFYTKYVPRHSIFETHLTVKCSNHERPVFASAVCIKAIVWKRASVSSGTYQTDSQKLRRSPTGKRPILVRYRGASSLLSFHCCNYGICTGGRRDCLWGTSTIAEHMLHISRKCLCTIIWHNFPFICTSFKLQARRVKGMSRDLWCVWVHVVHD